MWKQTTGDWQERRHRRSDVLPTTPQTNLPESVAVNEHSARGFLPRGFHDHKPAAAYPAPDGADTCPVPAPPVAQQKQQSNARALTETWVTVSGLSPDDVLNVRDFLDANVGRTVSHYLPPHSRGRSDVVYIQFASALQAAQAVRAVTYVVRMEIGVAALDIRPTIDADLTASRQHYFVEMMISWCTDQSFLAEREKLRRQLFESAAPTPLKASPNKEQANPWHGSAARDASLESSARASELPNTSGAAHSNASGSSSSRSDGVSGDADDDDAAAHPVMTRRRFGQQSRPQPSSPSPWPSRMSSSTLTASSLSPSPASSQLHRAASPLTNAAANPPVRDPAAYFRAGGAYQNEDNFFSDGVRSTNRDSRQRSTVLSLFFHPCSASYGFVYTLCLYAPLRLLVLVLWTLANAVRQFFPAAAMRRGEGADASVVPPPLTRWRQRRTLCASDVVPASASPLEYVAFFLYKYVPFTPDPEEVDVVLWSWLALHSPYPQRSLQLLKRSLLVRQRSTDATVGELRPGRGGVGMRSNSDVNQYTKFGNVDVLGAEPYNAWEQQQQQQGQQEMERRRELPVLLRWRPAWWFSQYSSLSLLIVVVLLCCHFWYSFDQ